MAGCGGNSGVSSGFERFSGAGVTVDYPSGWSVDHPRAVQTLVLSVHGKPDANGLYARLTAFKEKQSYASTVQFGKSLATRRPFELEGGHAIDDRAAHLKRMGGAWRVRTRYEITAKNGERVEGRGIDYAVVKDGSQYQLTLSGPTQAVAKAPVQQIADSWAAR